MSNQEIRICESHGRLRCLECAYIEEIKEERDAANFSLELAVKENKKLSELQQTYTTAITNQHQYIGFLQSTILYGEKWKGSIDDFVRRRAET